jgi:putative ABC transport system permease protein
MHNPRFRKILSDLRANKTRTLLAVLTIAVGVFAIGFVTGIASIFMPDMDADYKSANPHAAMIFAESFSDDQIAAARQMPGVADVEGRRFLTARMLLPDEKRAGLQLTGISSLEDFRISRIRPDGGVSLPPLADGEIWIERSSLSKLKVKVGDMVKVELADAAPSNGGPSNGVQELRVAGLVRDVSAPSTLFTETINGFVNPATLAKLSGIPGDGAPYTQLLLTVSERQRDDKYVLQVAQAAAAQLQAQGVKVLNTLVVSPGRHFSSDIATGVMVVLTILGVLIVLLSMFLVVNTITSLLGQHIRQIGIMKAIGGSASQIIAMYLALVLSFGVVALLVALPLAALAAYATSGMLSDFLNFDLRAFRVAPNALLAQAIAALVVPVIAALVPVLSGTRITIRRALSDYGIAEQKRKYRWGGARGDREHRARGSRSGLRPSALHASPATALSLRNAFRRKGRLIMTLFVLTLGGAIFIAVFNLRVTFAHTLDEFQVYYLADVKLSFNQPYSMGTLEQEIEGIPGIEYVEGWGWFNARTQMADPNQAIDVGLTAIPANTRLSPLKLTNGRWLTPDDQNALVVVTDGGVAREHPELAAGREIVLRVNDKDIPWRIVGLHVVAGNLNPPILYVNAAYLSQQLGTADQVNELRIATTASNLATQQQVARAVEARFKQAGIPVGQLILGQEWRKGQAATLNVFVYFLLVMAVLIAVVGGLGLTGTMSMNVLERTREIGVLRAIGASNGAVMRVVLVEGLLIGLISWVLAVPLSFPVTLALDTGVGVAMFKSPLNLAFGWNGLVFWLAGVLALAVLASLLPAARAVRLTVRDVLAYE